MLTHVWLIPGLMVVSFAAILLFGKRFSERITSGIGVFFIAVCFVLACVSGVNWIQRINHPVADTSADSALVTQPDGAPAPIPGQTDTEAVVGANRGPAEGAADTADHEGEAPTTEAG